MPHSGKHDNHKLIDYETDSEQLRRESMETLLETLSPAIHLKHTAIQIVSLDRYINNVPCAIRIWMQYDLKHIYLKQCLPKQIRLGRAWV